MYAAWFRRYNRDGRNTAGPAYSPIETTYYSTGPGPAIRPEHGQYVTCILEEVKKEGRNGTIFSYWSVVAMVPSAAAASLPPLAAAAGLARPALGYSHKRTGKFMQASGFVCVTNQNIGQKHDERVFFTPLGTAPYPVPLQPEWRDEWQKIVLDYRGVSEKERVKRANSRPPQPLDAYLGKKPNETAFSRHSDPSIPNELGPGDLCYARISASGAIVGLYPVMIGRELAKLAPLDLSLIDLQPARCLDELSPADRVFGWVNQDGNGAWRGQLRVGSVVWRSGSVAPPQQNARESLPLAILSTPKPQQGRFYLAQDRFGTPLADGIDRAAAFYRDGTVLRGRKVYPHHVTPNHRDSPYWSWGKAIAASRSWNPATARDYVRPPADHDRPLRDGQNRSVEGWVEPGAVFAASIEVINLAAAEIGALLWLLDLPDGAHHRLGGGKPLGFGSVRITIEGAELEEGEDRAAGYRSLVPPPPTAQPAGASPAWRKTVDTLVTAFEKAVEEAYARQGQAADDFERVSFIAAFLQAARGFGDGKPVHYPRKAQTPDRDGKSYEWFVTNEQTGGDAPRANRMALGPLAGDPGLPYFGGGQGGVGAEEGGGG